jgi:hypothetical protein
MKQLTLLFLFGATFGCVLVVMGSPSTGQEDQKSKLQAGPPTYSHVNFPIEQTINYSKRKIGQPGCYCGYDDRNHRSMSVSPTSVPHVKVGQPITLRYDASEVCLGQTIANLQNVNSPDPRAPDNPNLNLGTADWQVGSPQSLPREWGEITFPGYTQSGTYTVTINIRVLCKDKKGNAGCTTGSNGCGSQVSVPINVE